LQQVLNYQGFPHDFINRRNELKDDSAARFGVENRQELSSLLNRYAEKINHETLEWAEQARREAREHSEREAAAIMARAEEEARALMEKTRADAVAAASKEAELIRNQARNQVEDWLKVMRRDMAIQIKEMSGILHKELLAQTEAIRQRASAFETNFDSQITDLLNKDLPIPEAGDSKPDVPATEKGQLVNKTTSSLYPDRWIEIKIAEPFVFGILQLLKTHMDQLLDLITSEITTIGSHTSIYVFLKKPFNLSQALASLPEVKRVEEMVDKGEKKLRLSLHEKPSSKDNEVPDIKGMTYHGIRANDAEVILNWQ
jgi:hypothetical protein